MKMSILRRTEPSVVSCEGYDGRKVARIIVATELAIFPLESLLLSPPK
jgi:hypothetical protein